jgi:hypothetical protein
LNRGLETSRVKPLSLALEKGRVGHVRFQLERREADVAVPRHVATAKL